MWSWHIWITTLSYTSENSILQHYIIEHYELMEYNVGHCSEADYDYEQRSITIRFKQNQSNMRRILQ